MDDGTPIKLRVTIDRRDGSATFDFEGTGQAEETEGRGLSLLTLCLYRSLSSYTHLWTTFPLSTLSRAGTFRARGVRQRQRPPRCCLLRHHLLTQMHGHQRYPAQSGVIQMIDLNL